MLRPIDVFADEGLCDASERLSSGIVAALDGIPVPVALSALFVVFQTLALKAGTDAGTDFEAMLALFEQRLAATHRGCSTIQ